jgi:hypothetical protein
MDLVEDDERRASEMMGKQVRSRSDLLVGDRDAVDVRSPGTVRVAPARVEVQAGAVRTVRPLRAQRRRRADDDDLVAAGRPRGLAGGQRLAGPRRGDEQVVRPRRSGMRIQEGGLPRAQRDGGHSMRPPLARLQRAHSAWPLAGAVAPPARCGVTWSACQPGASRVAQRAQRPPAARYSATREADLKRRGAIGAVSQR